jgi:hypothetical protein
MRSITVPMRGTPLKVQSGAQPHFALPLGQDAPNRARLGTGPTQINGDGVLQRADNVTGAVGEQQFMQLAGGQMAIYRKHDGALQTGPVHARLLFDGAGNDACSAPQAETGAVLYDQLARRWLVGHLVRRAGQAVYCIAISTSADAAGSYRRYALKIDGAGRTAVHAEDARMALWSDGFYLSLTLFDNAQNSYRGPRVCYVERRALLEGRDAPLRCVDPGNSFGPIAVASLQGSQAPPNGTPAMLLALDLTADGSGARLLLWRFGAAGTTLSTPLAIPVAPFAPACSDACIGQPSQGASLFAPGDRLMPQVTYRHERGAMVLAHAVQTHSGQTGLRWYELRDPLHTAQVYQQGTHAPDRQHRAMGSVGMDKTGNIALAYSVAGVDLPASLRYSGHQRSDPPGRMQREQFIVNGNGVQTGAARPLPVSGALSLDPLDECTFWYTQRYVPITGVDPWRARIASFKFNDCL